MKTSLLTADATFGIQPMLAKPGPLPSGEGWAYEIKWDGVRALVRVDNEVTVTTRTGNDISAGYPELQELLGTVPESAKPALYDGEIIAFNDQGVPDFGTLQRRMNLRSPRQIEAAKLRAPVQLAIFDAPVIAGESVVKLPYDERRQLLDDLDIDSPSIAVPASYADGEGLLKRMVAKGMEGVVAKQLWSAYSSGLRSANWTKVKCKPRQEFVVGGWLPGNGRRADSFGALLLGVHEQVGDSRLRYMGNVGAGLSELSLSQLATQLGRLSRVRSPFTEPINQKDAHFVKPALVVEVEYQQLTSEGRLRQPILKGFRHDKSTNMVIFEGFEYGESRA